MQQAMNNFYFMHNDCYRKTKISSKVFSLGRNFIVIVMSSLFANMWCQYAMDGFWNLSLLYFRCLIVLRHEDVVL